VHSTDESRAREGSALPAPLRELLQRAREGDYTVLPELKEALDADPTIWQTYGDLAFQARTAWLGLLAGKDLLLYQSVERKLDDQRAELAGPHPSPLEKLLVERVAACWLQTMYADALYAQARGPGATPGVLRELMKRQESSQRRYLAAIKQLALVRKLLRPSLSPVDLAMSSVGEGQPAGVRWRAPTSPCRLAGVTN
jgi:hypothetical protein